MSYNSAEQDRDRSQTKGPSEDYIPLADGIIESNYDGVVDAFDDMNLKEDLLRGIYAYGFEKPSAIQQRAILPCIG
ncbi:unnamed protein product, partial [Candidula unifasciata]